MTGNQDESGREPDRRVGETLAEIADPGRHVGGGTAAAVAAALAAAAAALVGNLSVGRKSNRERAAEIRADLTELDDLQARLLRAAREDEDALHQLMIHYKDRDVSDTTMIAALERAAQSSLAIAGAAAAVCEIAARQAPIATRFTVSDLGAAAAIARGAATAALLTAETNLALLTAYEGVDAGLLRSLEDAIRDFEQRSQSAADTTLAITRERIG